MYDLASYLQRRQGLHFHCRHLQTMNRHHILHFKLNTATAASREISLWLPIALRLLAQTPCRRLDLPYVDHLAQERGRGAHESERGIQSGPFATYIHFLLL